MNITIALLLSMSFDTQWNWSIYEVYQKYNNSVMHLNIVYFEVCVIFLINVLLYTINIPDLYRALFMQNTFKCALHCVAAIRAHVHPLPVQIRRNLTSGTARLLLYTERNMLSKLLLVLIILCGMQIYWQATSKSVSFA